VIASVDYLSTPVLPLGSRIAVGLAPMKEQPGSPQRLVSVDVESGAVRTGPEVARGSFLLPDLQKLYLVSPAGTGAAHLRPVNVASLGEGAVDSIHGLGEDLASSMSFQTSGPHAGDLWVGTNERLELIVPRTGAVLVRAALPGGVVDGVAPEPDGNYVDVAVGAQDPSTGQFVVILLAFEAGSGTLAARRTLNQVVTASLSAVPGGLWVSTFDGQYSTLIGFAEPLSLLPTRPPTPVDGEEGNLPVPGVAANGSFSATLAGDVVVLTDISGASCTPATRTSVLAKAPFPAGSATTFGHPWTPFAGIGRTVFALSAPPQPANSFDIVAVSLPVGC
jgi:hypothetical protein